MKWHELNSEECPVARGLSIIGDRWTILILRDCFLGIRRFEQFQKHLGITRHLLAARLKKLVTDGVLERCMYQEKPQRFEYRLTQQGRDFFPVLMSLINWSQEHTPSKNPWPYNIVSRQSGEAIHSQVVDEKTGEAITVHSVELELK